jgi:hypothetical protein
MQKKFGMQLPKGFVIDSANYYTTAEVNTACINYKNKFVFTPATLSLLTIWGIADKTCKTITYAQLLYEVYVIKCKQKNL